MEMKIGEIIDKMQELRILKDEIRERQKAVNAEYGLLESKLVEMLDDAGLEKASGKLATASLKYEAYPQVKDKDAMTRWAIAHDRIDIIQARVNAAPIREMFENENTLPDGVELFTKAKINFRRK